MSIRKDYVRPIDFKQGRVDMTHGAGGRASAQLIDELFARAFDNDYLRQGHDGALLPLPGSGRLVVATDGHVISPLFFPGGDIGSLAVHGTINDVAMAGARPLYLSASFIIESWTISSADSSLRTANIACLKARRSDVARKSDSSRWLARVRFLGVVGMGDIPR